ncbi:hypothetical protein J2T02_005679 [Chitinophaga terrae (ex Kim and Jung 2007)]|uniref:hypothetical protein n=1 Tax=Chitinophaga terrae (ex Kim and Jung 2007) TaxID=408074 RepID=UPI0027870FD9|nr:hypothetical protein [Chitinophaga terrae (ex Kim and Jung 2007)]MDQ0110526.1 hypothetical protein [Chitinophaga terrae (ex Kim and Jung 2007)]
MWVVIIAIIVFVIGKFIYDKGQQSNRISKEGGMVHKYKTLVQLLMRGHPNSKIFQVTEDSLLLGVSSIGGTTTYSLLQTFGKVTITWKVDSPVYGKHTLEWDFDEFMDQNKMVEKIMNDLKQYQTNVMKAY